MKITVIIASYGRADILSRMLRYLERQTRLPDAVILSTPDAAHLPDPLDFNLNLSVVHGPSGLTKQRNTALDVAISDADIVVFFDDDFLPADNYLMPRQLSNASYLGTA